MLEIRVHGLGGEGVVKLSEFLGLTAVRCGMWAHSFPFFGTEVRGAAVKAFTRIDQAPINLKTYIYNPDVVILTNDLLLEGYGITDGLKESGYLLINSTKPAQSLAGEGGYGIHALDATQMALDIIGRPIANTVLFGAFLSLAGLMPLATAEEVITTEFSDKIAAVNLKALRAGFETVKGVK